MTIQELYDSIADKNLVVKIYEFTDDNGIEEYYAPPLENVAEYNDEVVIY